MTTHTGTTTRPDGTVLQYEIRGSPSANRPSLVLLHYYGGSPSTWAPLLSQRRFADFHSISYHARGWAPSTGPADPAAYGIAAMSADLSAVLSATRVQDSGAGFVLVGHSMGAKVAQYFAATSAAATHGLKALVLVAPAPLRGVVLPEEAKQQQLAAYKSAESVRFVLDHVLTAGPGTLGEEVVEECVEDSLRGNEWAKRAWPEYGMAEDYAELVGKIDVPVLVLRGDKDFERDIVGPLGVEEGWVNNGVEKCGHLIPLERPEELGKDILSFIAKI